MIIQCDQCSARFKLDDAKVTGAGVRVRCKRCQHIFLVTREVPQEEPDLDTLLMGLQPGTTEKKIPPQGQGEAFAPPEVEVSLPVPGDPHPAGVSVPVATADREPGPDFSGETTVAEKTPEEFSFSFEPSALEHEPPAAPPVEYFSSTFGAEMPEDTVSDGTAPDTGRRAPRWGVPMLWRRRERKQVWEMTEREKSIQL